MQIKKCKAQKKKARKERLRLRLKYQLSLVEAMPDETLIGVQLTSVIRGRSVASTWRDVKAGLIPQPIKIGNSSRFRLGGIRNAS